MAVVDMETATVMAIPAILRVLKERAGGTADNEKERKDASGLY